VSWASLFILLLGAGICFHQINELETSDIGKRLKYTCLFTVCWAQILEPFLPIMWLGNLVTAASLVIFLVVELLPEDAVYSPINDPSVK